MNKQELTTATGLWYVEAGGQRWCVDCIARVDAHVEDPAEQAELFDAVPDEDGILHAEEAT